MILEFYSQNRARRSIYNETLQSSAQSKGKTTEIHNYAMIYAINIFTRSFLLYLVYFTILKIHYNRID